MLIHCADLFMLLYVLETTICICISLADRQHTNTQTHTQKKRTEKKGMLVHLIGSCNCFNCLLFVQIPKGVQPGQLLVLRGRGILREYDIFY